MRLTGSPGSGSIAISPASDRAFIGTDAGIAVIDLDNKAMLPALTPVGAGAPTLTRCQGIAFAPAFPHHSTVNWVVTVVGETIVYVQPDDPTKWATAAPPPFADPDMPVAGLTAASSGSDIVVVGWDPSTLWHATIRAWVFNVIDPGSHTVDWRWVDGEFEPHGIGLLNNPESAISQVPAPPVSVAGGPDAAAVITGLSDGNVIFLDWRHPPPANFGYANYFPAGSGRVTLGVSGHFAIAGTQDGTVTVFDLGTNERSDFIEPHGKPAAFHGPVAAAGITADGTAGIIALSDGTLHMVRTESGKVDAAGLNLGFTPAALAVSPALPMGRVVVTGANGEILMI